LKCGHSFDQFQSPWLQTHFDIGNVMQYGYPQDWILTLGARIKRVHVKDYKLSARAEQGRFVDLLEGDVNWKEVMAALVKVGYHGFLSPEISHDPKDPEQLKKVSRQTGSDHFLRLKSLRDRNNRRSFHSRRSRPCQGCHWYGRAPIPIDRQKRIQGK